MNILNVGIPELLLLGVILLVIFCPDRFQDEAKKAARIVRAVTRSETYRYFSSPLALFLIVNLPAVFCFLLIV